MTIDKWYNNDKDTEPDLRKIINKRNIDTTLIPHPVDKLKFYSYENYNTIIKINI